MIINQIRFTIRRLLKNPMISTINLSGLSIGIACAYLGLSYAWQEFSFDKSFADSDRIYRVGVDFMNMGGFAVAPEYLPEYLETHSEVMESYSRVSMQGNITLTDDEHSISATLVACDTAFFRLFDFPLEKGDYQSMFVEPSQAIISEDLAWKWFGDLEVLGRQIELPVGEETREYIISGIIDNAAELTHLRGDIFVPIGPFLKGEKSWYSAAFYTYFKLKDKNDFVVFTSDLESIRRNEVYENYAKGSGLTYDQWIGKSDAYRFIVHPLTDIHLKSSLNFELSAGGNLQKVKGFLLIGLLVLLVAMANYINLTTARSYTRSKEIGVKKTLGVNRSQLIRQFIGESLIESMIIAILAIVFINLILKLFNYWTGSTLLLESSMGFGYVSYLLLFTLIIGLLTSIYPAFYLGRISSNLLLKNESSPGGGIRFRSALVVAQFAITTALICGSLVISYQLKYMSNKDLGFDKEGLMVIDNMQSLGTAAEAFRQQLVENSMVISSSFASSLPGSTNLYQSSFKTAAMESSIPMKVLPVDADFIETMGIKLMQGNNFQKRFERDSTVAIINESAKEALGLSDPIGEEINIGTRVIGVVSDFHIGSLKEGIQPIVLEYNPIGSILSLRLDARRDHESLASFIQNTEKLWKDLNPDSDLSYSFIDETFAQFAEQEYVESKGILALTGMALLIACLGLFGLTTYTVKKREKEISIRKILGSTVTGIVTLLSREFLLLILFSLSIALPIAWYFMNKWLQNFAYRIELNWWIFGIAAFMAVLIALVTVGIQTFRAALQNPVKSLRNE